jgi:membrane associated rhomboid family serine protease
MIPIKDDIPTYTYPYVTVSIIAINVVVFIYQLGLGFTGAEFFIYRTAVIPYEVMRFTDILPRSVVPPPLTIFTAMFVHVGLLHLGGNMLFLWIFGDNIEDSLGHLRFVLFYLGTGVAASMAHIILEPDSTVPMVGASGAIAGVLGAYILLYPRAKVMTLVFLVFFVSMVRVPAVYFLGLWFFIQILSSGGGGGIAWYAHVGGFIAGLAIILLFRPKGVRGNCLRRR